MNIPESSVEHLRAIAAVPDLGGERYQLVQELGRGGMGVVYQVHDLLLERDVAVKVLSNVTGVGRAAERLRREAQTLALLEHPGIVPIHDAGTLPDGRRFYAMKLVQGFTIAQRRPEGSLAERLRLFLRICEPIELAHSKQIIHRDLKPANIMVGPFGEVLVMDWGIARALTEADPESSDSDAPASSRVTADGVVIGTPGFMAPEQAAGRNDEIDERTDVWSLGAVLRFLVEGVETANPSDWKRTRKPLAAPPRKSHG